MTDGFFSRLFLVPKKEGQMRPVLPLNKLIYHKHFKMEGIHTVRDLLQRDDWMTRINIKDAYFAIPIYPQHQRFLRFQWKGKCFQFTCLPFGLVSAPRVFTKLLRSVVGFLRSRGMRCVVYIDDLLLLHQDKEKLREFSTPSSFALSRSAAPQASGLEEEGLRWAGDNVTRSSQGPCTGGWKT